MADHKTITRITVKDFIGLKAAELEPGKRTDLAGGCRTGKTSFLKAVKAGFEGMPQGSIRDGADKSEIFINLSDGMTIKRVQTAKGEYVHLFGADGVELKKPQATLNALRGGMAFNPVALYQKSAREQRAYVLERLPITLPESAIDPKDPPRPGEAPLAYIERRAVGLRALRQSAFKVMRDAQGATREAEAAVGTPPESTVSYEAAQKAHVEAREQLAAKIAEWQAWERQKKARAGQTERVEALKTELGELRVKAREKPEGDVAALAQALRGATAHANACRQALRDAEEGEQAARQEWLDCDSKHRAHAAVVAEGKAKRAELDAAEAALASDLGQCPDTTAAKAVVDAAAATVAAAQSRQQWDAACKAVTTARAIEEERVEAHAELDRQCKELDFELPKRLIAEQSERLAGLEIRETGLWWQGRPVDQLSGSEQLCLALDLVRQLAGELDVICVDGLEALDEPLKDAFDKEIQADRFQYFTSRVGKASPGDLVVEGGVLTAAK